MRFPLRAVAVSAAIGIIAGGLTVAPASARAGTDRSPDVAPSSLVVKTEQGRLAGSRNAQVDSFLGVPFAAPPVGDLLVAAASPGANLVGGPVGHPAGT